MKTPPLILLVPIGFAATVLIFKPYRYNGPRDFVLSDPWSKSNAVKFGKPPEGWSIVCADGKFVPKSPGGTILDSTSFLIRTSHWDAVVASWRVKGIWDAADNQKQQWKECE